MIKRNILSSIKETLTKYPIIALTGPRQSGKTTFLKNELSDFKYVNLEDPELRAFVNRDPKGFLESYPGKVIIDEAQHASALFSYLQVIVDDKREMGQFILSGSQNFQLMEKITQSLAGRVALFRLFPFDFSEMVGGEIFTDDTLKLMSKGFYPAIYDRSIDPDRYYSDYISTYVKRDVAQLVNLKDDRTFTNFIKLCAARAGHLVNFSLLARDAGISHSTARNWINILETSYIVTLIPPYFKNYNQRLIKSPKLYFYDCGLLAHLLGYRNGNISKADTAWGHLFENMMVAEMIKQNAHLCQYRDFYFWRDSQGHEIDLLYTENGILHLFEIKSSSTIQQNMFKEFDYFERIATSEVRENTLVYGGANDQKRTDYFVKSWMSPENDFT